MKQLAAIALVLASTAAIAQRIPPPTANSTNPCGKNIPCPVCPKNDPNGCGIYDLK